MLSIEECKKMINAKENGITNEEVKQIEVLFYFRAEIEFLDYQKMKENEECDNL